MSLTSPGLPQTSLTSGAEVTTPLCMMSLACCNVTRTWRGRGLAVKRSELAAWLTAEMREAQRALRDASVFTRPDLRAMFTASAAARLVALGQVHTLLEEEASHG